MVDADARLRNVEERLSTLQRQAEVMEQNSINNAKKTTTDIRAINAELSDIKAGINQLKEELTTVTEEIKNLARKDDVEVIKKYLDLWEPVKFVQQSELEGIFKQLAEEKEEKKEKV